jgi:thiamine-monophosphate kinase
MGALPQYALFSIGCAADTEVEFILELGRGICGLAAQEKVAVIGGDTTASPGGMVLGVTAGGLVSPGRALLRSGARPGEAIMVTGNLGSAAAGMLLFKDGVQDEYMNLRRAFVSPRANVAEARLAAQAGATAMTDLSDGLASDLRHICGQSSVGARVDHDQLPVDSELIQACDQYGWSLDSLVLAGGEDYGLLFTMPAEAADAAIALITDETGTRVSVIGEVTTGPQITVVCEYGRLGDLPEHGFDHFRSHG